MSVRFSPAASHRLDEIWAHTAEEWSAEQAERYIRGLFEVLENLPSRRYQWRPVLEPRFTEVFLIRYQHHFVFFRELSHGDLGIITILHERMDLPRRLLEDDR